MRYKNEIFYGTLIVLIIAIFIIIVKNLFFTDSVVKTGGDVYKTAQETIEDSKDGISNSERESFNNMFLKYEGTQKGSTIKTLLMEVNNSSTTNEHQIKLTGVNDANDIITSNKYTVSFKYDNNNYINEIIIK